jgi:hypothetical protein
MNVPTYVHDKMGRRQRECLYVKVNWIEKWLKGGVYLHRYWTQLTFERQCMLWVMFSSTHWTNFSVKGMYICTYVQDKMGRRQSQFNKGNWIEK